MEHMHNVTQYRSKYETLIIDTPITIVVYQFTCASCGARYIGETNRHFNTRVNEHLFRDKNSHTSVLLKGVRISAIFLVLRLSIMPAHILNLK